MASSKQAPAPPKDDAPQPMISIRRVPAETLLVPIVGTSPLIVHAWSAKARQQMLDTQQGRKAPKVARDPQADYEASFYRLPPGQRGQDRYGFPTLGFKAATTSAARFYDKSVSMTGLRQFLFFSGEQGVDGTLLTEIFGEPKPREDCVRVGQGGTDLRFRAEFLEWTATLRVTYVMTALDRGSVLSLIDAGGMGVGVGEWRPEKSGANGTYRVDETRELEIEST